MNEPIFVSPGRKVRVVNRRVGDVSNEEQHTLIKLPAPDWVELGHNCCCVDVIAVVCSVHGCEG